MHLIVLDDDEAIAQSVAAMAGHHGWSAQGVTREAEFQALIRDGPPDAIILDLQLDDSDGIEQLHFLRDQGYSGAIILMSGFGERVLASARRVGETLGLAIVAVLEKPARAVHVGDVLVEVERHAAAPSAAVEGQAAVPPVTPRNVADALDAHRMELHLQPIVAAADRAVNSAEALIRWQDPVLGLVDPEQFIPIAEQDPMLIDRLTMWVVESGVTHYRRLAELGVPVRVSINVSSRSLRTRDFPDRMAAVLEQASAPRGAIGLEITESAAMDDMDVSADVLTRLRLKGFPVALDDFGTGHQSLTSLRQLPFSAIKIDKSFVGEMERSEESLSIVRSVIQLARDLGLESVAEGVATAGTARLLTGLGINFLQGHYFSPPLPVEEFAGWLREWMQTRSD